MAHKKHILIIRLCVFLSFGNSLLKGILQFPNFAFSYKGLGRSLVLLNHPEEAINPLKQSIKLSPDEKAYIYLIQAYSMLNQDKKIPDLLKDAKKKLSQ